MIAIPGAFKEGLGVKDLVVSEIARHGTKLSIKDEKTSIVVFRRTGLLQSLDEKSQGLRRNGLEYLGFRFDGAKVYVRDQTISGFYRKLAFASRSAAFRYVARYPGKDIDWLIQNFPISDFLARFGRVRDFEPRAGSKSWTFWTYLQRSAATFGPNGSAILRQGAGYKSFARKRLEEAIVKAIARGSGRDAG